MASGDLSDFLRELRETAGRPSLRRIAEHGGHAHAHVSDVLAGRKHPGEQMLADIIDALGGSSAGLRKARTLARASVRPSKPRVVRPRMLPEAFPAFAGRAGELDRIGAGFAAGRIVVVSGMGGIGKSCLAVRWAKAHARRFRAGILYADLHGFDREKPELPQSVIETFLTALGVAVPADPRHAATTYREVTGPSMLVVLDNAADVDQVRALLPGAGAAVLVTSRDHLHDLGIREHAYGLALEPMTNADAYDVLAAKLGESRLTGAGPATAALIEACAGVPLALGIVGTRLAAHPDEQLATVAAELDHRSQRLDLLDGLRTVISWSDRFDPESRRAVCLLSAAPPVLIGPGAAAALFGLPAGRSREILRAAERTGLVFRSRTGRFGMHEHVRLYFEESAGETGPAVRRLVHYYLHSAYAGQRLLSPARPAITIGPAPDAVTHERWHDERDALAWFDAERATLPVIQRAAADRGWHAEVWQLAWCLDDYLYRRGAVESHERSWSLGLAAAERIGDPDVIALAEMCLGRICAAGAERHLRRALDLIRPDDLVRRAQAHRILALRLEDGRTRDGLHHAIAALRLFRRLDEPMWTAMQLNAIGETLARLGHPVLGRPYCEQALLAHEQLGNRNGVAATRDGLGTVEKLAGDHAAARRHYEEAIDLYRQIGNFSSLADTTARLGDAIAAGPGGADAAVEHWQAAYEHFIEQGRLSEASRMRDRLTGTGTGR